MSKPTYEIRNCLVCGKERRATQAVIKLGRGKFCSLACSSSYSWQKPGYRKHMSDAHKNQVQTNLGQLKEYVRSKVGRAWASALGKKTGGWNKGQKFPQFSGPNHYAWKEDRNLLAKQDERNGNRHKEWSLAIKNRDSWTCKISNQNCSGAVVAHHILPWAKFVELRYNINNGITLCQFHHPRKRAEEIRLAPSLQRLVSVQVN